MKVTVHCRWPGGEIVEVDYEVEGAPGSRNGKGCLPVPDSVRPCGCQDRAEIEEMSQIP